MKNILKKFLPITALKLARYLRQRMRPKVPNSASYYNATNNLSGLEIGGPSTIFKYQVPVYKSCFNLDFVNFSSETIWEGLLSETVNYYGKKIGRQYVSEASYLSIFADKQFDFLLSSNCLEHVANPIKALLEWKRITSGKIVLILPRKDFNFDHKRSITSFQHLLEDYRNDVDESDLTHLDEIYNLHDLALDLPAGSLENFKQRSLKNNENRGLHHHVFDDKLVRQICDYLDMSVIEQSVDKSNWIFLIEIKH